MEWYQIEQTMFKDIRPSLPLFVLEQKIKNISSSWQIDYSTEDFLGYRPLQVGILNSVNTEWLRSISFCLSTVICFLFSLNRYWYWFKRCYQDRYLFQLMNQLWKLTERVKIVEKHTGWCDDKLRMRIIFKCNEMQHYVSKYRLNKGFSFVSKEASLNVE